MNGLCSHERLELALSGLLSDDEESTLHLHLKGCELCSAEMERLAGGEQASREIAAMLVPDDLDDALPLREECSTADFVVDHLEPSDDPAVLGRLGGYDVLDIIGRGGMGVVLKGFDRELKRLVAIKALAPHLANSALARKRFAREAQAAAAVVNLHVIAIHQVQPNGQLPFLVMPLLTGESLAQRLKARGTLELKEILRIGMQAAEGLAAAHGQGLIHRDVKPANILLEKGVERAVLTDFGLARAADDVSMTRWGIIAGTPEYMSPEQARGEALDGRSDLFSLGCVLYEIATGVSPFRTDSTMATLRRIVDEQPAAMASLVPELPPWFCHIIERLLSKDPARRFASASEVSQLLEQCLSHLQQPASVPLPASLVPHATGRRSIFNVTRKGIIAMLGTIGMTLLGMVLWQATEAPDISGQWTSDEWGTVVLEAKGPGQYVGTFSGSSKDKLAPSNAPLGGGPGVGTFGSSDKPMSRSDKLPDSFKIDVPALGPTPSDKDKAGTFGFSDRPMSRPDKLPDSVKIDVPALGPIPSAKGKSSTFDFDIGFDRGISDKDKSGTVHLKWSRVERRFNGTWGKNNDRSGKLSLRLVGDGIRGAWTTRNDAQETTGTPRLGDLLWTRSQVAVGEAGYPATELAAAELEKQIRLQGRELFYGRMELTQEFKTLWTTKEQKRENVTSKGTVRWLKNSRLTRIDSDRMVPGTGTTELQPEQWTTGYDGVHSYSWDRAAKLVSYGTMRPGAIGYSPNLLFWGRTAIAYPQPMFGPNPKITRATRDGREEFDVVHDVPEIKLSIRYVGIAPDRGYLPTRVETRNHDRLESQVEFQDFFQPRPGVWAAKTILWTAWAADNDADEKPIVASRTKFTVTKLELGDDAKLQDEEFKLKLPDDVKVVHAATANAAAENFPSIAGKQQQAEEARRAAIANEPSPDGENNLLVRRSENGRVVDPKMPDISGTWRMGKHGEFGESVIVRVEDYEAKFVVEAPGLNGKTNRLLVKWSQDTQRFEFLLPAAIGPEVTGKTLQLLADGKTMLFKASLDQPTTEEVLEKLGMTKDELESVLHQEWTRIKKPVAEKAQPAEKAQLPDAIEGAEVLPFTDPQMPVIFGTWLMGKDGEFGKALIRRNDTGVAEYSVETPNAAGKQELLFKWSSTHQRFEAKAIDSNSRESVMHLQVLKDQKTLRFTVSWDEPTKKFLLSTGLSQQELNSIADQQWTRLKESVAERAAGTSTADKPGADPKESDRSSP